MFDPTRLTLRNPSDKSTSVGKENTTDPLINVILKDSTK